MHSIFTKKAPVTDCKDIVAVCDLPGLAELGDKAKNERNAKRCTTKHSWTGCKDYAESVQQIRTGDLSGVGASDSLMQQFESLVPLATTWGRVHDVVGGVPNVGAYVAGHPLSMVRRQRQLTERGPLTIFCSLELSSGVDITTMRKRGATVLAFVRLLSTARPVSLYAVCSLGQERYGVHVLTRIDSTPLDLARAAHILTCPSVTRGVNYAVANQLLQQNSRVKEWNGRWAYDNVEAYRRTALDNFKSIIDPSAEAILIPAAHIADQSVTNPKIWLKNMLQANLGTTEE